MIILDTHVFIWALSDPDRLSRNALRTIRRASPSGGIGIASITLWEVALLVQRGRIRVRGIAESWIREAVDASGVTVREITAPIAALAVQLPEAFPRDPADRLIAATAIVERVSLVTSDERLRCPSLRTVW